MRYVGNATGSVAGRVMGFIPVEEYLCYSKLCLVGVLISSSTPATCRLGAVFVWGGGWWGTRSGVPV